MKRTREKHMKRQFEELPAHIMAKRHARRDTDTKCQQCGGCPIVAIEEADEITKDTFVNFMCRTKPTEIQEIRLAGFIGHERIIREIEQINTIPQEKPSTQSNRAALVRSSHLRVKRKRLAAHPA